MSPEIAKYHQELEKIKNFGGDKKETAIRTAFQRLLASYCQSKGLLLVTELEYNKTHNFPDGTVKDALRLDWGWWEAKDEDDDLDKEISKKLAKGYPSDNIIFEDSQTAVLFQSGMEVWRIEMKNSENLDKLLKKFLEYRRPEVVDFGLAIDNFRQNVPTIVSSLRELIYKAQENPEFQKNIEGLLEICRNSINPELEMESAIEMLIQHILTEEIFSSIFGESQFHRENNIAKELDKVEKSFFFGKTKRDLLTQIESYYNIIKAKAAAIADHHEKQKFLKVIYESFYRNYNPEKADTLGIVYTPNEIVNFMVRACDNLAGQFFQKNMADKNVKILDPATGTGTFITEIINFLPKNTLKQKYKEEIFCNEIAILPYYVANLNIEYTYKQKMGEYEEFNNIAFVDTLDNLGFGVDGKSLKNALFGSISAENLERIKRQNEQEISIIIGNPPYNANQMNFNDNNANREYKEVDERIKVTYIKNSTAQKTKQYDMYKRFLRWSSDRISTDGIVAMIVNRAFIDARQDDGFRWCVEYEFDQVFVVDLGGDARKGDKDKSVFDIQLGVAILFLVKCENKKSIGNGKLPARINYHKITSIKKDDKLLELANSEIYEIPFQRIQPDKKNNWLNQTDNDWQSLMPVASKSKEVNSVFGLYSNGVATNRDFWVYDLDKANLINKVQFFIKEYNESLERWEKLKKYPQSSTDPLKGVLEIADSKCPPLEGVATKLTGVFNTLQVGDGILSDKIKWSRDLLNKLKREKKLEFDETKIVRSQYRPFVEKWFYAEKIMNDVLTQNHYDMFGENFDLENKVIQISSFNNLVCLTSVISNKFDANNSTVLFPLYRYQKDENGKLEKIENITDWALEQFRLRYNTPVNFVATPSSGGHLEPSNTSTPFKFSEPESTPFKGSNSQNLGVSQNLEIFKYPINPKLTERAKEMAKNMTKSEKKVWFDILKKLDTKWVKQRIIGSYIVDFFCFEIGLAIEIDGESHEGQMEYDQTRTDFLNSLGIKVIRFTNSEVLNNLQGIFDRIKVEISMLLIQANTLVNFVATPSSGGHLEPSNTSTPLRTCPKSLNLLKTRNNFKIFKCLI